MDSPISKISDVIATYCYLSDPDSSFNSSIQFFTSEAVTIDTEWAFLPVRPEDDALIFYAFFKTDKALRFFNELGKASLGGPFISKLRVGVGTSDHLNALVAKMSLLGYSKFQEVRLDRNNPFVFGRLSRLRTVIERSVDSLQPTGILALSDIRKFRQHLAQGEFQLAQGALNQIAASGRLSSVNYLFLELQLMQKMGRDSEIWNHPSINEFVVTARPRAVTELLLESLWNYLCSSLTSGEISSIDDLYIQRMVKLLSGIRTPQSESGRVCLAIVLALSAGSDLLSNYDIPNVELAFLQEIIDTRKIPTALLPSNLDISTKTAVYDFSQIGPEDFHVLRQELVDDGDARGLFALLLHANSIGVNVESTIKNIVSVVEGEYLVELGPDAVRVVQERAIQTSTWTSNLQKKWTKVQFMALVFEDGFSGVELHLDSLATGLDTAFRVRVIEECFQSWSLEYFEDAFSDGEFARVISLFGNQAILRSAINELTGRLLGNGVGVITQSALNDFLN